MPDLQLAMSAHENGDLPELPVINMYVEQAPTEKQGVILQSRQGLADRGADMGAGPVQALFRRDLVTGGDLFGISDGKLYRETASVGAVAGSGFASIAGNEIGVFANAGEDLYFYNGTTLATTAFPDSADVVHVTTGGGRFWFVRKDTGKLYWTDALQSNVEALDFLTAESLPDRLLQTLWIDGGLIAFGSESVEFFAQTGSAELPIKPVTNMVLEKGIRATGCACAFMNSFAFVTNENQVCIQDENNIVSDEGLEKRIAASVNVSLFSFVMVGTEFLCLRLDSETRVFSGRSRMWSEFVSYGYSNWLPSCYADGVFGSAVDGRTIEFVDQPSDFAGVLERRFRAGYPLDSGGFPVSNMQARIGPGNTEYLGGDDAEPLLEMRLTRDAGRTWGEWQPASMGAQGEYRKKVQWRGLGMASYPGFLAEFRCTNKVSLRVSGITINEPWGGR